MGPLTVEIMNQALQALEKKLEALSHQPVRLIIGGGGAMILAHQFPLATADIDGVPTGITIAELDPLVKEISQEQGLPPDWLNPYFSTFVHTLPSDYGKRLISVFKKPHLEVLALGREEMLIMKCFAHRRKDVGHARALLRAGADFEFVESRIEELQKKGIPGARAALDFLEEMQELEGDL